MTSSRRATTQSSRCRSLLDTTGQDIGRSASGSAAASPGTSPEGTDMPRTLARMDTLSTVRHMTLATLTQHEAATRSALLEVQRYDIAVDMTGLLEGDV